MPSRGYRGRCHCSPEAFAQRLPAPLPPRRRCCSPKRAPHLVRSGTSRCGSLHYALCFCALVALLSLSLPTILGVLSLRLRELQASVQMITSEVAMADKLLQASSSRGPLCKKCRPSYMSTGSMSKSQCCCSANPINECRWQVGVNVETATSKHQNSTSSSLGPQRYEDDASASTSQGFAGNKEIHHLKSISESQMDQASTGFKPQPMIRGSKDELREQKERPKRKNSLDFCKTSRELYKKPLRKEGMAAVDLKYADEGNLDPPDVRSVLGWSREKRSKEFRDRT